MVKQYSQLYLDARRQLIAHEDPQIAGMMARSLLCHVSGRSQESILADRESYASEEDEGTFALYQATLGEKPSPQKIVGGISEVVNISDDLSTIYYIKNNNLYRNVNGKESKKLVADVESVYFSDSETFYFTKSSTI